MALPPGPHGPATLTMARFALRPLDALRAWYKRYGEVFSIRMTGFGTGVYVANPDSIRELFTGDQSDLLAGHANSFMEPVLGPHSVLVLDGPEHLRQRKLLLPPFQGSRVGAFRDVIREVAERELGGWRSGERLVLRERMRAITFEVICRAVFGVTEAERVRRLREVLVAVIDSSPIFMISRTARTDLGPISPGGRFARRLLAADAALLEEIERRRGEPDLDQRTDVLSLLMRARDEQGRAMTDAELRDELFTMLGAGHETTATGLAFAFELLMRNAPVLARLRAEIAAGGDDAYLEAVVKETLRLRPVIDGVERTLTAPRTVAGWELPAGINVYPAIAHRAHARGHLSPRIRVPPRALPRRGCRVLHLASLRWRHQALRRRGARTGGDGGGAARGAPRCRAASRARAPRPRRAARDHARSQARGSGRRRGPSRRAVAPPCSTRRGRHPRRLPPPPDRAYERSVDRREALRLLARQVARSGPRSRALSSGRLRVDRPAGRWYCSRGGSGVCERCVLRRGLLP